MSAPSTTGSLAAAARSWRPGPVEVVRTVDAWPVTAFSALLDVDPPGSAAGDPLPPLWHWFTLLDAVPQAGIGTDGHPSGGPFVPPVPGRRRMFAGGRLRQWAPIVIGSELRARTSVAAVQVKNGRSGEMLFVTVREELSSDGRHVATEEKDLVYRSEPHGAQARPVSRPMPVDKTAVDGSWVRSLATDPVLLFRFSALTFNAHRIHYDLPYATEVEGYPDLVIHGPLLALLALEIPRVRLRDDTVASIEYRLARPAFVPARIDAIARRNGPGLDVEVGAHGCEPSLTATMRLGASTSAGAVHGEDRP